MEKLLFAWLGGALLLGGCIENYPKDIAVVSIKAVDYREQAELPAPPIKGTIKAIDPYRDFLFALSEEKGKEPITPGDIEVYFRQQEHNKSFKNAKRQKPMLRVEFVSKENLHEFAKSKSYPVSIVPYFCDRPKTIVDLGGPRVFLQGLNVGGIPYNYAIQRENGKSLTYYAFLNVVYDFAGPSSYEHFDLRTNPEDVCFQLKGGAMGFGFESNVVMIPRAETIKALSNLPTALKAGVYK